MSENEVHESITRIDKRVYGVTIGQAFLALCVVANIVLWWGKYDGGNEKRFDQLDAKIDRAFDKLDHKMDINHIKVSDSLRIIDNKVNNAPHGHAYGLVTEKKVGDQVYVSAVR